MIPRRFISPHIYVGDADPMVAVCKVGTVADGRAEGGAFLIVLDCRQVLASQPAGIAERLLALENLQLLASLHKERQTLGDVTLGSGCVIYHCRESAGAK